MNRLLSVLLKQHQLGKLPGAAKASFGRTLTYVGYVQFCMIAAMAFVTFGTTFAQYAPWLTFKIFVGVMVVGLLALMLLDYKFMLPSEWNFTQKQMWEHMNPTRAEFEGLGKRLDEADKKNDRARKRLWKKLGAIEKKIDKGGN